MKKLYFKYGTMGSSKSAQLLMTAFNYKQKNYQVLLIKPVIDTRDFSQGKAIISSRIGLHSDCITFSTNENLYKLVKSNKKAQVVLVDEVQFCKPQQIDQLKKLTQEDYIVICYGLKTNFKGKLFAGSKRLLEISESIQEIKSICKCGSKAIMNARIINNLVATKGAEIEIGGDERYESMCYNCYLKHKKIPLSSQ